ncbi:tryptophan 2,3-dioxygenase family protein [Actinomadura chibensis]|uniref:tryptophan 2,3-dioxygenase family protein n=1 Tax=Actinomadura chibensis TaxID=392828 RepID=UPI000A96912D|nr:tryptophan 2,3-dioxygenase family protein [Actinomadura chibensis]
MRELTDWLDKPDPDHFPYDQVMAEFLRVGKHFVDHDLLKDLGRARESLPVAADSECPGTRLLRRFLDTALDKWDGRYDYGTYIALGVLPVPRLDDAPEPAERTRARRDRLTVQLLAETLGFELDALDGTSDLLPEMRPGRDTVLLRCRHGLRVARPALGRVRPDAALPQDTRAASLQTARRLCSIVAADATAEDRRVMRLSFLPVYVSHDEHLFIRVLQTFETTFSLLSIELRDAAEALAGDDHRTAVDRLSGARRALAESAPLFSLLATMQVEAFRDFRTFTEGASAIQSRAYKEMESLCRVPDHDRLDSAAYLSAPEVRDRVLAGRLTLDEAYRTARTRLPAAERDEVTAAMRAFSATLGRWRQTHFRLAVRMLGERSGTGYTAGTPYLSKVREIPVFHTV